MTVGSRVWRHTQGSSGRPASDLGWGSTGSPAGRTPPHGDGSMYSQANVRVESVLRPPPERCRPWSWTLKRVAGSGWVREAGRGKTAHGWKGVRPGVRL